MDQVPLRHALFRTIEHAKELDVKLKGARKQNEYLSKKLRSKERRLLEYASRHQQDKAKVRELVSQRNAAWKDAEQLATKILKAKKPPNIPHGSLSGYTRHRCRCDDCRYARAEYERQYRAKKRAVENP